VQKPSQQPPASSSFDAFDAYRQEMSDQDAALYPEGDSFAASDPQSRSAWDVPPPKV